MNRMINKAELHGAILEAAKCCAKRVVNSAFEEAEAEKRMCEAPDEPAAKSEERAVKAWRWQKKRGMSSMKRLAELAGHIAITDKSEFSLSEVICEAFVW